jgi:hypothetical protein
MLFNPLIQCAMIVDYRKTFEFFLLFCFFFFFFFFLFLVVWVVGWVFFFVCCCCDFCALGLSDGYFSAVIMARWVWLIKPTQLLRLFLVA